jgi:superoxide dismutase
MSKFVQIKPRALKPALLQLDGISRTTIEAHYRLYQGYVAKRNEILGRLPDVDLGAANQVYSELRALKVDLTFAIGGIKNHELYFEHLGGEGGDPGGAMGALVERDFGSAQAWRDDLKASGMAGRGWAWTLRTPFPSGMRPLSWRSTCTSTPTSSTIRPIVPPTSRRSSRISTGASSMGGSTPIECLSSNP